jgi:transcriptional regulator with XRE-family HTH domain
VLSEAFADVMRRYRLAARLTQTDLAARAGLSREAISALERGLRQTPARDTVLLLGDALELGSAERDALLKVAPSRARSTQRRSPSLRPSLTPLIGRDSEMARASALGSFRQQHERLGTNLVSIFEQQPAAAAG